MCFASTPLRSSSTYVDMNKLATETNYNFSTLLELAANDDIEGFKCLIDRDPSSIDEVALWYGRKKGTKIMVLDHRTPLMVASSYGSINIVKFIILFPKIDVNYSCGSDEIMALHCAASSGSTNAIDVVTILLEAGANRNLANLSGLRPFDVILVSPNCIKMKFSLQLLLTPLDLENKIYSSSHDTKTKFYDLKNGIYSTDEFRMFSFKIRACSRAYSHDWTECPFLHPGENARRRDPRMYNYGPVPCPDFRKGFCRKGDMCKYSHGVFESWLHPNQYRTRICKDGSKCDRKVCFFAHKQEELRTIYVSIDSAISSPRSIPNKAQTFPMYRSFINLSSSASLETQYPSKLDDILFSSESSFSPNSDSSHRTKFPSMLSPKNKPVSPIGLCDFRSDSSTIWGYNGRSFRAIGTDEFGKLRRFNSFVMENEHEFKAQVESLNEGSSSYPRIDVVEPTFLDTLIEHIHLDHLMAQ